MFEAILTRIAQQLEGVGRPRDLEDVKGMLIKNPGVDTDYVKIWLQDFAGSLAEPFQERFERILEESR